MSKDRARMSIGPNARPMNETIAPDEASAPKEEVPERPDEARVADLASGLHIPETD